MSGPNRERKHGDQGPDYHVESLRTRRHMQLWDRPKAKQLRESAKGRRKAA